METRFENYLLSKGWTPSPSGGYYSSLGMIHRRWTKDGLPSILTGLNEVGMPPTLISPRPIAAAVRVGEHINYCIGSNTTDAMMDRAFAQYDDGEILNAIITGATLTVAWQS